MIEKLGIGTSARRTLLSATRSTLLGGAFLAVSAGCGGAPPPAPSAPVAAPAAPTAVIAVAEPEPAEPSHVVGIMRWRKPNSTLDTIYKWTGIRLAGTDLASQFLDSGLASTLSFDAPVDAVVALDPKATTEIPLMAVSVGVQSVEAARRAFQAIGTVTEVRPGEFRVNLQKGGKKKSDRPACLLLAARGPAPGRFLCGRRDHDVDALRGYLARTLPERDLGDADVHLELHAPPVLDIYAPMITQGLNVGAALLRRRFELGEPTFDRALGTAVTGASDETRALLADLDTIKVDFMLAPERASASVAMHLKGQQSWMAGTLATQAPRAAAPPEMFWALPATSTSAGYTYPPEHQRFDAIRHTLGELLDGFLAHESVAPADRTPLVALFDDKFVNDSAWVTAGGRFEPSGNAKPAAPAAKGATAPIPPANPLQAAVDGFGWYMVGVATPNQTPELVKSLAAAVSRPKLQATLRAKIAELMAGEEDAENAAPLPTALTWKPAPLPKELPKGSTAYEITLTREAPHAASPNKKAPPAKPLPPVKMQVLVVPESARTWVIFGSDKAQLVKTVVAATEGAPLAGKLSSRTDLGTIKDGKFTGASFATLQSFLESIVGGAARMSLDPDGARSATEARTMLESTPNRGKTPILFTSEIGLDNGITWRSHFDVPKGVIEDAIVLAASSRLMLPRP